MKQPQQPKLANRLSGDAPVPRRSHRQNTSGQRQRNRRSSSVTIVPVKSQQTAQWLSNVVLVLSISIGCGSIGFVMARLFSGTIGPSAPMSSIRTEESIPGR
ncbi:hypothetical protein [Chamaesiphon sp. VAR_48_metabat_135_sub]|uniref:hypothetical protein n=1 Tax=Chamaesiphon sp. VAR_48_metabat_135_sub TaxID=2964699 RepID=UPI00286A7CC9|nr:hypothetical protein [Chamaesiphon sp. VAR_48_metabat_135_sub]